MEEFEDESLIGQMASEEEDLLNNPKNYTTIVSEHQLAIQSAANGHTSTSWIKGKKWTFSVSNRLFGQRELVLSVSGLNTGKSVVAEAVFWQSRDGKEIHILQKSLKEFHRNADAVSCVIPASTNDDDCFNVLIRLLSQNGPFTGPFPSEHDTELDVVRLEVDSMQFRVSKPYLVLVSPVFAKMFSHDRAAKKARCREVVIKDTNVEVFSAFLEAISPEPVVPNPSHVMGLLKFAERYEVKLLRDRCESLLINRVEISLIDRLLLAEVFHLETLKNYIIAGMSFNGLREFYNENREVLVSTMSRETLIQIVDRVFSS